MEKKNGGNQIREDKKVHFFSERGYKKNKKKKKIEK